MIRTLLTNRLWIVMACVPGLLVLFIASIWVVPGPYLDYMGARSLEQFKEMMAREHEAIDLKQLEPVPVPDEENFCAIPVLKDITLGSLNPTATKPEDLRLKRLMRVGLPWGKETPTNRNSHPGSDVYDIGAWSDYYRKTGIAVSPEQAGNNGRTVLAGLAQYDGLWSEMSNGLARPYAVWTPAARAESLDAPFIRISSCISGAVSGVLHLRARAAAAAGDAVTAHQSVMILERLIEADAGDSIRRTLSDTIEATNELCGAVNDLCRAHCGKEAGYTDLGNRLSKLDYCQYTLERARIGLAYRIASIMRMKLEEKTTGKKYPVLNTWLAQPAPDGLYDGSAAVGGSIYHDYDIVPLRDGGLVEWHRRQQDLIDAVYHYHKNKLGSLLPFHALSVEIVDRFQPSGDTDVRVRTQCLIDEARAACALERYRIENGVYPEKLDDAYSADGPAIPLDITTGKAMEYHKAGNGYSLRCAGVARGAGGYINPDAWTWKIE